MKLYERRIAFCISDQHMVPHGGIGQFAKGFVEMSAKLNWKIDLILDKAPSNQFTKLVQSLGAEVISPIVPVSYSKHTGTFAFNDSINFEKMQNFRDSLMYALSKNLYDMIICNSMEAMPAALGLDLDKLIPVVFYTHEESMVFRDTRKFKGVFTESCNEFFNRLMTVDNAFVGTQSTRNVLELKANGVAKAKLLPMPMSERGLLIEGSDHKEGVLYIGRWEDRKNPEAFLKVIKETGLPAKIMTNENGKRKFIERLAELKITNYTIKAGIVGQEKVDFIKSAKVHFNPSLRENYPFTFFECLGHMPCIVIDKSEWVTNFDKKYYIRLPLDEVPDMLKKIYDQPQGTWYEHGALDYVRKLDDNTAEKWLEFLNGYQSESQAKSDAAKINEYSTVKYFDYIVQLKRKSLAIEDVKSVLTNKHKYNILYTDSDTYLSKDRGFKPEVTSTGLEELFT
jgi:glycosyltransferase involved in cell wall biosynthesis